MPKSENVLFLLLSVISLSKKKKIKPILSFKLLNTCKKVHINKLEILLMNNENGYLKKL